MAPMRMNVNLEDVIDKIIMETKKSKKELLKRIATKKDDLGGLITDEGAACIVAKELGVEVFETTTYKRKRIQLKDLIVGMNAVSVIGRINTIFSIREFTQKSGQKGTVAKFLLQDPTGQIKVVLWNEQTKIITDRTLEENNIIEIKNAYVKGGFNNELELHLGKQGIIEQNPKGIDLSGFENLPSTSSLFKINQLQVPMNGDVIGKIQWKSNITTFKKKTGTGQVANLNIFDKTGQIRVALWGNHATFVEEVSINDIVKIVNGYTRQGRDNIELHVGDDSKILKDTSTALDIPDTAPITSRSTSIIEVKIKELTTESRNLKVIGKIIEKGEPRDVKFKDGSDHRVCDVTIADETGSVSLSIWDEDIEKVKLDKAYCVENGYVSVFRGSLKLNAGKFGTITPSNKVFKRINKKNNLSNQELEVSRKYISNLRENEVVEILGTIVSIPEKNPIYKSCPKCSKKVTFTDETWNCERCGKIPNPVSRMLWSFSFDDGTENMRVTVGGKIAEELLGMTTAEAEKMIEKELIEQYPLLVKTKELLGKNIILKGNIRYSSFSNSLELRANSIAYPTSRDELSKMLVRVENSI
ncbi:MAG: DUF2240 family protein [Candidatus Helarchaeota archaeon]|nr:DUF2240 family protein [Candidatus Helarchaeota archaeon]